MLLNIMSVPYVINLDRSTDRWESLQTDWKGAFPVQRVSAVEASPGWVGCAMSHIKIIEEAKARGDPHVLIWEDDCIPRKRNGEYTNVQVIKRMWAEAVQKLSANPGRWDIVLGASSQIAEETRQDPVLSGNLVKLFPIRRGFTTHWTLYNASIYDYILAWKDEKSEPIDVYMYKKARVFVTYPFLAEQRPGHSLIENGDRDYAQLFDNAERKLRPEVAKVLPFTPPNRHFDVTSILPKVQIKLR